MTTYKNQNTTINNTTTKKEFKIMQDNLHLINNKTSHAEFWFGGRQGDLNEQGNGWHGGRQGDLKEQGDGWHGGRQGDLNEQGDGWHGDKF